MPRDAADYEQWTQEVSVAWNAQLSVWQETMVQMEATATDATKEPEVRAELMWNQLNTHLENFLKSVARASAVPLRCKAKPCRAKGTKAEFRKVNRVRSQPYDNGDGNSLRVLRRLWGRLKEVERIQASDNIPSEKLLRKIHRIPHWSPQTKVEDIEEQVKGLERKASLERLQQWRARLRSSTTETFRWLRGKNVSQAQHIS